MPIKKPTKSASVQKHWSAALVKLGACQEAIDYALKHKTFRAAWNACTRGDHMLWLLAKQDHKHKRIVAVACDCAALALPFTKDPRVSACLDVVRAWTRGEATIEQVNEARRNAADAAAAAAADAAAAAAAAAATYAAAAAATYADAAAADAAATYAAAAAATAAADAAYARSKTLAHCADIVRREFPSIKLTGKL